MNFQGIDICCPNCHGELSVEVPDQLLRCRECARSYPVILGIPDLRVFPDPYIDFEADRAKGVKVGAQLERLSFRDLVAYYYSITEVVPDHHAAQYTRGLMAAVNRSQVTLASWLADSKQQPRGATLLEIGCGTGPLLTVAAPLFKQVIGVDIAFRWLVVAKKRLAEAGFDIPLICACAEALPFRDQTFNLVVSESTIEHVHDQAQVVAQCYRVLRPQGAFFLTTPNRFSLGPDPQVGIWAGSWLPESWLAAIVVRQGGIPPKRRLLSHTTLTRLLASGGFDDVKINLPEISPSQMAAVRPSVRWLMALYNRGRLLFPVRQLLLWLGPLLNSFARKDADSSS